MVQSTQTHVSSALLMGVGCPPQTWCGYCSFGPSDEDKPYIFIAAVEVRYNVMDLYIGHIQH